MHGYIGFEAEWAVAHGWTPSEAMLALTRNGALLVGDTTAGVLESGSRADFVVLRRNPLDDIAAVHEIDAVYRAGEKAVDADGTVHAVKTAEGARHP
jgi:imidazolonepropionase-like amidohydrolase